MIKAIHNINLKLTERTKVKQWETEDNKASNYQYWTWVDAEILDAICNSNFPLASDNENKYLENLNI